MKSSFKFPIPDVDFVRKLHLVPQQPDNPPSDDILVFSYKEYLQFMLSKEHDCNDKLLIQKTNPFRKEFSLRFSSENQRMFFVSIKEECYHVLECKPLPLPIDSVIPHREASSFYLNFLILLAHSGIEQVSVQRIAYERMNWTVEMVRPFHCLSAHALTIHFLRQKITPTMYHRDPNSSLHYFMTELIKINETNDSDNQNFIIMSNLHEELIWAYAPWQIKNFARASAIWHLDATYKLLQCGKAIFAIVLRSPVSGRGMPAYYFIVNRENTHFISFVLEQFCT
jgi:hypothetical protein